MIKVQDDSDSLRAEMQRPYISAEVMEYLRKNFDISYLLAKDVGSESMRLGYIKGVQDVIDSLSACQRMNAGK